MAGNENGTSVGRRRVLKVSGAVLGGIAVGGDVVAAEESGRFVVDTKGTNAKQLDDAVDVVHDISEIDVAVVRGKESDLKGVAKDYVPDIRYDLSLPNEEEAPVEEASEATDEPFYPLQWDKQVQNVPSAHEVTRGEGSRVAIIDTGVDAAHPDLAGKVNTGLSVNYTADDLGTGRPYGGYHGTHVAGIVAADDENDAGVVGTAPGAELVDLRVFSEVDEGGSFGDIAAAMVYSAAIGCDVANLSLGAYPVPRQGLGSFYGKVLQRATAYARRNGTLLVAAAGNDATDLQHDGSVISVPNEAANVMSIAATGPIGNTWGGDGLEEPPTSHSVYTNYGTNAIDMSGPGGDYDPAAIGSGVAWYRDMVLNSASLPAFDDDGNYLGASRGYYWLAGTSMAAPQVAGAAALVAAENPNMNAKQVRSTLTGAAADVGPNDYHGRGFVDPNAAVRE